MEDGLGRRGNSTFYGAMLLTAGSLGLRLVQMAFQVYISGVMGAAGLGKNAAHHDRGRLCGDSRLRRGADCGDVFGGGAGRPGGTMPPGSERRWAAAGFMEARSALL